MLLVRARGRFRKSKSAFWCNQMRLHSIIYMLEFKSNLAGKFLQLSLIKRANRTFVIFPADWNNRGWVKIFDSVAEIEGQSFLEPVFH